jgi:hypothetical protein
MVRLGLSPHCTDESVVGFMLAAEMDICTHTLYSLLQRLSALGIQGCAGDKAKSHLAAEVLQELSRLLLGIIEAIPERADACATASFLKLEEDIEVHTRVVAEEATVAEELQSLRVFDDDEERPEVWHETGENRRAAIEAGRVANRALGGQLLGCLDSLHEQLELPVPPCQGEALFKAVTTATLVEYHAYLQPAIHSTTLEDTHCTKAAHVAELVAEMVDKLVANKDVSAGEWTRFQVALCDNGETLPIQECESPRVLEMLRYVLWYASRMSPREPSPGLDD